VEPAESAPTMQLSMHSGILISRTIRVREEVFDVEKRASKLQEFAKDPDIGTMVWDMHKGLSHGGKKKNKTGEEDKRA